MEQILLETALRHMENEETGDNKSHLTHPAFQERVSALGDKGRATDTIDLGLCESLTPSRTTASSPQRRCGFEGRTLGGGAAGWMAALEELGSMAPCPSGDQ